MHCCTKSNRKKKDLSVRPSLAISTATTRVRQSASPVPGPVMKQPVGPCCLRYWLKARTRRGPQAAGRALCNRHRSNSCWSHSPHPDQGGADGTSWPSSSQGTGITEASQRMRERQTHIHTHTSAHQCTKVWP